MNPRTTAKIAAAREVAATLPAAQAKIIRDLCTAHATMCDTASRLWHDNAELRRDMGTISMTTVVSEAQRIARRHIDSEGVQGGESGISGATTPTKTQDAASGAPGAAFSRFMALAWPWVLPDSPEWLNLRAAFNAGWQARQPEVTKLALDYLAIDGQAAEALERAIRAEAELAEVRK